MTLVIIQIVMKIKINQLKEILIFHSLIWTVSTVLLFLAEGIRLKIFSVLTTKALILRGFFAKDCLFVSLDGEKEVHMAYGAHVSRTNVCL